MPARAGDRHDQTPEGRTIPGHRSRHRSRLVRQLAADRYDIQGTRERLAAAGNVAGGWYAIITDGTVKAAVSRRLADELPHAQSISVDISDEEDAAVLPATVLAIEAGRYERSKAYFNPRALLDLLNPLNWLWLRWQSRGSHRR